jgi:high-affinity nickel-transport protein
MAIDRFFGSIEMLGLIGDQQKSEGPVWEYIGVMNNNFGIIGVLMVGIINWLLPAAIYRQKWCDFAGEVLDF